MRPLTSLSSAPAEASFVVGPVFARSKPSLRLSPLSPVRQAGSEYVVVVVPSNCFAFVGQPMPVSHCAWTRNVLPGSNSPGFTWRKLPAAYATPDMTARRAMDAASVRSFI